MSFLIILLNVIVFVITSDIFASANNDYVDVMSKNGMLRGKVMTTLSKGKPYNAFLGVPYAQPPINNLRFKPPRTLKSWYGIKNATEYPSTCIQSTVNEDILTQGKEDCLYLNIFAPANHHSDEGLPVFIYIRGSSFYRNFISNELLGPDFLIDKKIIVVTLQHRVGIMGFLALPNSNFTGNMGIKDVQMAVKWVYKNIGRFGGNNKKITLAGSESGSISAQAIALNPISSKYIRRTIMFDATLNFYLAVTFINQEKYLLKTYQSLDIPVIDRESLLEFLCTTNAEKLVAITPVRTGIFPTDVIFLPTLEPENAEKPVMVEDPVLLMKTKNFTNVDFLIGFDNNASALYFKTLLQSKTFFKDVNKKFNIPFPTRDFDHLLKSPEKNTVLKEIKDYYFDGKLTACKSRRFFDLMTDVYFGYPQSQTVKYHGQNSLGSTYHFRFGVNGELNLGKLDPAFGSHGAYILDYICYMFRCPPFEHIYTTYHPNSLEYRTVHSMVSFISNFVRHGNPNKHDSDFWLPVKEDEINFMEIDNNGNTPKVASDPDNSFWDYLLQKYKPSP